MDTPNLGFFGVDADAAEWVDGIAEKSTAAAIKTAARRTELCLLVAIIGGEISPDIDRSVACISPSAAGEEIEAGARSVVFFETLVSLRQWRDRGIY